jgi:hypothetical protein
MVSDRVYGSTNPKYKCVVIHTGFLAQAPDGFSCTRLAVFAYRNRSSKRAVLLTASGVDATLGVPGITSVLFTSNPQRFHEMG